MALLSTRGVTKRFGATTAVFAVDLDIRSGEFFSILGPSGCGKTTLLRLLAGFDFPDEGTIEIGARDVTGVAPASRGVGMVFQNYALFPHMSVAANVAFGLEARSMARGEIDLRVDRVLRAVRMQGRGGASVDELSGGEQQRVALARAMVVEPAVLLLDEPLSNLDVALRLSTREELRSLQRSTGVTMVYVTHDQAEAMSLSDRMAVMRNGQIEQSGTPVELYERPATQFVAEFLGAANILGGEVLADGKALLFRGGTIPLNGGGPGWVSGPALVAAKPEALTVTIDGPGFPAVVEDVEYLGYLTTVLVNAGGQTLRATNVSGRLTRELQPGARVRFTLDRNRCTRFAQESG